MAILDQERESEIFLRLPKMNRRLSKNIEQKALKVVDFARCISITNGTNIISYTWIFRALQNS